MTSQAPKSLKKQVLQGILKAVFFTLAFFVLVELALRVTYAVRNSLVTYVPLPYVLADDYGPYPPWLEENSLMAPDEDLIWRNRPNLRRRYIDLFTPIRKAEDRTAILRRFRPSLQASLKGNPVWEVALNSEGFRDAELPDEKPASVFRIVCLGDSWTFGTSVGQADTYPQRLATLLGREFPEADFEVCNRGVMGYSSFQGLQLFRKNAAAWKTDVVVIGYAMNDSKVSGLRDKDWIGTMKPGWSDRIGQLFLESETFRLTNYLAQVLKYKPSSIASYLEAQAKTAEKADGTAQFSQLEPWVRVSPADYEKNVLKMIRLARERNAGVILLYNEFWEDSPYRAALKKVAETERVPLVDTSALVAEARKKIEEDLERKLGLEPAVPIDLTQPPEKVEVLFRVYAGKKPVPKAIFLVGAHPELGDLVPNKVAMYDDGTHGDQHAGDRVWTYTAAMRPGTKLFYVYTNSGEEGKWEGLDVPYIREFEVEAKGNGASVYRPIETFGRIYLRADAWHTNAWGYELVANALIEALKKNEKFRKHVHLEEVSD
jgi:lysophospholipase L1-like esterase